eukprot:jgi/Mesvir1/16436/Mv25731-RA.1
MVLIVSSLLRIQPGLGSASIQCYFLVQAETCTPVLGSHGHLYYLWMVCSIASMAWLASVDVIEYCTL